MTGRLAVPRRLAGRRRLRRGGAAIAAGIAGLLGSAGLAAPALASPSAAAPADSGSRTVTVGDSSEAWYSTPAGGSCAAPGVCPSLAGTGYPAGTLHVAVGGGTETARTYVTPDLSAVPAGYTAVGGTMTLPLATVTNNGNLSPQTARIEACLSYDPAPDGTAGSSSTPPQTDCAVSTPVKVGATAFTVDLAPFLAAWESGQPNNGIALLPDLSGSSVLTGWHVAFDGRKLQGQPPISSALILVPAPGSGSGPAAGSASAPAGGGPADRSAGGAGPASGSGTAAPIAPDAGLPLSPAALATGSPAAAALPAPPVVAPSLAAPTSAAVAAGAGAVRSSAAAGSPAVRVRGGGGFQYPASMLLPLVLLAGVLFALRLFTTDATPARRHSALLTVNQENR